MIRGDDGLPGLHCAYHKKASVSGPSFSEVEEVPGVGAPSLFRQAPGTTIAESASVFEPVESTPIASIRGALRDGLLSADVADSVKELILEGLRATKDLYVTCPGCKHRNPVSVPDLGTRISAARALLEELEGKLAQQASKTEDKIASALAGKTRLQDLSDDELLLVCAEDEDWDLRDDVYEAARRVLAAHPFGIEQTNERNQ